MPQNVTPDARVDIKCVLAEAGPTALPGGARKRLSFGPSADAVRSGGKVIGVSWFGEPFPDLSTSAHLEYTVRLIASGCLRIKSMITQVLPGIESVPQAFEIAANKGIYKAISPVQVTL
jgi:threonine dehydrogenase-like Zn-dependent dehydrogenase